MFVYKNISNLSTWLILCFISVLPINTPFAGSPIWTITPLSATTIVVPVDGSAIVIYQVTNKSKKSRALVMTPITGITQVTTQGNCNNPFILAGKQSCTLVLEVSGKLLKDNVVGGPQICARGSSRQCYRPNRANSLNISIRKSNPTVHIPISLAVGNYSESMGIQYPLLAQSEDNGSTWNFRVNSSTPTLPSNYINQGKFTGASCQNNFCIAVGRYQDNIFVLYPLLAQSSDYGQTWSYRINSSSPTLPANFITAGVFNSAKCNTNLCIAAGSYRDIADIDFPLLAQSTDQGITWNYRIDNTLSTSPPAEVLAQGILFSSSCNSHICMASGFYANSLGTYYPLLAQSTNSGTTWSYHIDSSTPTLPADFLNYGVLTGASCNSSICIAVGAYQSAIPPNTAFPLLALSTDNGTTWSYRINGSSPTLPADYAHNFAFGGYFYEGPGLRSIYCEEEICIAGGYYSDGTLSFPLLAQSTNNGTTWNYHIDSSTPNLPSDFVTTINGFTSVSCNKNICVAGGSYNNGTNNYPLLAQSTDHGATWSYRINSTTNLPNDYVSTTNGFTGVSCNPTGCTALGSYFDLNGLSVPLLAHTTDTGATWVFLIDSSTNFPSDYSYGGFNSVTDSKMSYLPDSLKLM